MKTNHLAAVMLWRAWLCWELDRWPAPEPWSLRTTWWRPDASSDAAPARTCHDPREPEQPEKRPRLCCKFVNILLNVSQLVFTSSKFIHNLFHLANIVFKLFNVTSCSGSLLFNQLSIPLPISDIKGTVKEKYISIWFTKFTLFESLQEILDRFLEGT